MIAIIEYVTDTDNDNVTDTYVAKCWGCHNPYNECQCDNDNDNEGWPKELTKSEAIG
jgi:hypothetical protein